MERNQLKLRLLAALAALGWVLAAGGCSSAASDPPPPADGPNVLHVLTDDQTIDSLRHMKRTKRLLGRKGTTFTNYNDTQPLCCPSRATFLTGQYPHNHGVLNNVEPYGYPALDFDRTIYTALHDGGYRTGWMGKVLNPVNEDDGLEPEPGFDEWFVPLANDDMFDYVVSDNGERRRYSDAYQNDVLGHQARKWIGEPSDRPFFLTVSTHTPHWSPCESGPARECAPEPAPQDVGSFHGARFPLRRYVIGGPQMRRKADRYWRGELESLQSVDRLVASLVAELRKDGELDNTLVIFQSDNGLLHGEHGVFIEKNVPWDRSVRVPLLIRGAGFRPGSKRADLTANVDVPATILDVAGVEPPLPPDGYSLRSDHRRRQLLLERLVGEKKTDAGRWLQLKTAKGWTFWRDLGEGRTHLFNLNRDPNQLHDLARRMPRMTRKLNRRAQGLRDCADPCP